MDAYGIVERDCGEVKLQGVVIQAAGVDEKLNQKRVVSRMGVPNWWQLGQGGIGLFLEEAKGFVGSRKQEYLRLQHQQYRLT